MMALNVLNIPLSTVLYEKEDFNAFMKVFENTVQVIINEKFRHQVDESDEDSIEMQTLWVEIIKLSKNIISYSLDLVYESLEVVLEKLSAAITHQIETEQEDPQLAFFLKYISIPEIMGKLLNKTETRNQIMTIYDQISDINKKHSKSLIEALSLDERPKSVKASPSY